MDRGQLSTTTPCHRVRRLSPAIERMPDREHAIVERRLAEHAANLQNALDGLAGLVESS